MMLRVKRLYSADTELLQRCAALAAACLHEGWTYEGFLSETRKPGGIVLTVMEGETVCGFLTACVVLDEAELTSIGVLSECRRRGAAALLMETFLRLAEGADVFLEVRQSNVPAIALYRKFGFVQTGIRRNFYECPTEDAVRMKRGKYVKNNGKGEDLC